LVALPFGCEVVEWPAADWAEPAAGGRTATSSATAIESLPIALGRLWHPKPLVKHVGAVAADKLHPARGDRPTML
jgi:hypothetical protein